MSGKENRDHIARWYETTCEFALNSGLRVIGLGADGCSLVRSYYSTKCLTTDLMCIPPDSYVLTGGAFKHTIHWNEQVNFICFSDPRHLLKKFRNPMLSLSMVMVIGDHLVDLNDVRLTFKHLKLECGIYRTDFDVSDKQNVDAVMRLIGESCFHALAKLETLNPSVSTLATRTFLKYGKMLHDAFFKRESNIGERLSNAFQFLYFLEASKAFTSSTSNSYTWKKNGLTSEEMLQDTRFAVSSLVFGYLDCVLSSFDGGYHPWMYGSDSCERCFGTCRTMRNMRELNLLDLRNSIERWFFQETLRKNSNIQVNRPNSNKRMLRLRLVDGVDEVDDGCATESEIEDDLRQYSNILQSLDEVNEIISDLGELGMLLENNDYDQDEQADNFKPDLVTPTSVQAGGRLSPSASIATNLNDDTNNVNQAAQRSSLHVQYKGQYYHLGRLCSLLDEKKKIKPGTRVTRFWNVYADYMQPLMAHQDINLSPRVILKGDHVILWKRESIDAKGIYLAGKYVLAKVCSLFYVPKESS